MQYVPIGDLCLIEQLISLIWMSFFRPGHGFVKDFQWGILELGHCHLPIEKNNAINLSHTSSTLSRHSSLKSAIVTFCPLPRTPQLWSPSSQKRSPSSVRITRSFAWQFASNSKKETLRRKWNKQIRNRNIQYCQLNHTTASFRAIVQGAIVRRGIASVLAVVVEESGWSIFLVFSAFLQLRVSNLLGRFLVSEIRTQTEMKNSQSVLHTGSIRVNKFETVRFTKDIYAY